MIERRAELRIPVTLSVKIWALDAEGNRFEQDAIARNISSSGALLCGVVPSLRPKDLMVVQYRNRQASFRVVWTRASGGQEKNLAAVQLREADECPWRELIVESGITVPR